METPKSLDCDAVSTAGSIKSHKSSASKVSRTSRMSGTSKGSKKDGKRLGAAEEMVPAEEPKQPFDLDLVRRTCLDCPLCCHVCTLWSLLLQPWVQCCLYSPCSVHLHLYVRMVAMVSMLSGFVLCLWLRSQHMNTEHGSMTLAACRLQMG